MKKLLVFTAEPGNFVPKSLAEEAKQLGYDATILDVKHCMIAEGVDDHGGTPMTASLIYHCAKDNAETGEAGEITVVPISANTVVIPRLNEYHLEVKLSMLARMRDLGATLLNSVESMELCNDKLQSQVKLNTAGIKTPYSFTLQNPDDVEKIVAFMEENGRLKYPTIVKTLRGTHGIGVMKLDSRSALVSVAQMLLKEGIEFLVQEFIKHDQSARIIMIGDQVLAANLRGQAKEKDEFRTNSHLGSETEPYTPSEEEVALGRRIVELFGCDFCAIDYITVERDGKKELIVLEVNGSPGLEAISKNWPDRNLPLDVVKYAMGHEEAAEPAPEAAAEPAPEAAVEPVAAEPVAAGDEANPETAPEPEDAPHDALEEVEPVIVHRITPPDATIEARIDTGAKTSSLHADKIVFDDKVTKFTRGDVTFKTATKRVVRIKNIHNGENSRRPVVCLDVTIHGKRFNQIEFTLTDRSNMKYEVLIGRNVLENLGLPVLISKNPQVNADVPESDLTNGEEE